MKSKLSKEEKERQWNSYVADLEGEQQPDEKEANKYNLFLFWAVMLMIGICLGIVLYLLIQGIVEGVKAWFM